MSAEALARLAEAVAALIWPVLALVIAIAVLPVLREVVRQRQFTIKVAGFELSAQQATDQLKGQIEDLQAQVTALAANSTTGGTPAADAPGVQHETIRRPRAAPGRILWVDDIPSNNAMMIDAFQRMGLAVESASSTDEGLALLSAAPDTYLLVISDLGRQEGGSFSPQAGTALVRQMREAGFDHPVAINTSADGVRNGRPALAAGANLLTNSPTELRGFVERHLESGRADQLHP